MFHTYLLGHTSLYIKKEKNTIPDKNSEAGPTKEVSPAAAAPAPASPLDGIVTDDACARLPTEGSDSSQKAAEEGVFSIIENAPGNHHFTLSLFQPVDPKNFIKFVRKEVNLLKTSLPQGISVRAFEDRMVISRLIDAYKNYALLFLNQIVSLSPFHRIFIL